MDKFRFRVVGIDLDYDLKRYPEGSTIELTRDAAYERRRWLELIDPVEGDKLPLPPVAPELTEPPAPQAPTSAAFVSGPTGAEVLSVQQPPAVIEPPAVVTTKTETAPKASAAAVANKDKGARK